VQYVVFDLLYHRGRCLLGERLAGRREELAALCARLDLPEVVFSAGVVEAGTALYALALARGHEGVMAKRLSSTYRPGRRAPAWRKIKPRGHANRLEG
jgi:ATP-dependent DNA ligase